MALKEITDRLVDFEFDMITARLKKDLPVFEKIGRINVYRLGVGWAFDKYWLALSGHCFAGRLHKKNHYSAIWSMMASYNGFAALSFKAKNPNLPFLLSLQEGDPIEYIERRIRFFKSRFKKIFTSADYIQTISRFLANWAGRMNNGRAPVEVVPNAVDFRHFSQKFSDQELTELKKKVGQKPGDKLVVTASRLVAKNGLDDLISAFKFLPAEIKLMILGEGPDSAKLKEIARQEGLSERVIFLGQISHSDLPKYLKISDIFVRPSLSEGLGNSFLEAMAAEIPVVATPVGGIPDFLFDRRKILNSPRPVFFVTCTIRQAWLGR